MGTRGEDLKVAANAITSPPSSVEELHPLLDKLGNCLSMARQTPLKRALKALKPAIKALTEKDLFNHVDVDVKVSVAFCINEIMRITAPDAPFGDQQLKESFQLIVTAFENLSDTFSRSYDKRVSILRTFAKARSFVLMMDLKCDSLISEMFKHFLENLRKANENHPDVVFSSMGTIMILTLEQIDEIPPEFLSPLLDCVRMENKDVLPITRKLVERVIDNCASELKSCMLQAVEYRGFHVHSYDKIVARICDKQSEALERFLISQDITSESYLTISEKCDLIRRYGGKRRGRKPKQGFPISAIVPTKNLSSNDVTNDKISQPKNALMENQFKGTRVPEGKRSSNKVDSENNGNAKNSVLSDGTLNGASITYESGGQQLEATCVEVVVGVNTEDSSVVKQWGCKRRRSAQG